MPFFDLGIHTVEAEKIAAQLDNDGLRWVTGDGRTFDEITAHGRILRHPTRSDVWAVEFTDGSTLVVAGGCWDIGFANCWCWAGAGHLEYCTPR